MLIKVLIWNIRHGLGIDGYRNIRRVTSTVRDTDPDIVILNEVDLHTTRSGFINQAGYIASHLNMDYFFSPSIGLGPIGFGNAILTKGRLTRTDFFWLSRKLEPRKALIASIDFKGHCLTCIGVHLSPAKRFREVEIDRLLEVISTMRGKILLAGDFNSSPDAPEIRPLFALLFDVFAGDPKPTYPAHNPNKRIDYLFVSSDCNIISSDVLPTVGSDHLPLYVVIDI